METDIYHVCGHRRRNTDKRRKQPPKAKIELPHTDSMSTNADNPPMTTINDNEVERLRERLEKAEELIRGLRDGWKKARKAHLETCKNAQAEIDKLHTENICLQELIQEFYEWSRRDYPTEAEVREIMDRYYNLLNHNPNNKPS